MWIKIGTMPGGLEAPGTKSPQCGLLDSWLMLVSTQLKETDQSNQTWGPVLTCD